MRSALCKGFVSVPRTHSARQIPPGARMRAYSAPPEQLDVEFCVRWNYEPRFQVLKTAVESAFPGRFAVRPNPQGAPRSGAFEVILKQEGSAKKTLWSKLETGQPSNLKAAQTVAEAVLNDLKKKWSTWRCKGKTWAGAYDRKGKAPKEKARPWCCIWTEAFPSSLLDFGCFQCGYLMMSFCLGWRGMLKDLVTCSSPVDLTRVMNTICVSEKPRCSVECVATGIGLQVIMITVYCHSKLGRMN